MKTNILFALFLIGCVLPSMGQEMITKASSEKLLEAIKRDFPELIINENIMLPVSYGDKVGTTDNGNDEEFISYNVLIQGQKRIISASYDPNFKLISAIIKRTNVTPNPQIRNALAASYPGWKIAANSIRTIHTIKGVNQEKFKFTLQKGKKKITVRTDREGNIETNSSI